MGGIVTKAFLIDPFAQQVTQVDYSGDYREIYTFTGCECFTLVRPVSSTGEVIYVDDNGLTVEDQAFFEVAGYHQPLGGKGLWVGEEIWDEAIDAEVVTDSQFSLEWITSKITFPELALSHIETTTGETTVGGQTMSLIRQVPVFKRG
jgi:hypothetical protein